MTYRCAQNFRQNDIELYAPPHAKSLTLIALVGLDLMTRDHLTKRHYLARTTAVSAKAVAQSEKLEILVRVAGYERKAEVLIAAWH